MDGRTRKADQFGGRIAHPQTMGSRLWERRMSTPSDSPNVDRIRRASTIVPPRPCALTPLFRQAIGIPKQGGSTPILAHVMLPFISELFPGVSVLNGFPGHKSPTVISGRNRRKHDDERIGSSTGPVRLRNRVGGRDDQSLLGVSASIHGAPGGRVSRELPPGEKPRRPGKDSSLDPGLRTDRGQLPTGRIRPCRRPLVPAWEIAARRKTPHQ